MTVNEFIEKLQQLPEDAQVQYYSDDWICGEYYGDWVDLEEYYINYRSSENIVRIG